MISYAIRKHTATMLTQLSRRTTRRHMDLFPLKVMCSNVMTPEIGMS